MTEFRFTPADITVARDSTVVLVNQGVQPHSWILDKAGVGTAAVQPGTSQTLDLGGVAAGSYRVFCDQPGHVAAGQVGRVTITG